MENIQKPKYTPEMLLRDMAENANTKEMREWEQMMQNNNIFEVIEPGSELSEGDDPDDSVEPGGMDFDIDTAYELNEDEIISLQTSNEDRPLNEVLNNVK